MKHITILALLLTLLYPFAGQAQSTVVASGGESSQGSGSFSFSLGLVSFSFLESNGGTVTEGVQHTYEISQMDSPKMVVNAIVYPNPTTDKISIELPDVDISNTLYVVADIKGRELFKAPITSSVSEISLENMETGIYFISILKNRKFLTGFKIIKK